LPAVFATGAGAEPVPRARGRPLCLGTDAVESRRGGRFRAVATREFVGAYPRLALPVLPRDASHAGRADRVLQLLSTLGGGRTAAVWRLVRLAGGGLTSRPAVRQSRPRLFPPPGLLPPPQSGSCRYRSGRPATAALPLPAGRSQTCRAWNPGRGARTGRPLHQSG